MNKIILLFLAMIVSAGSATVVAQSNDSRLEAFKARRDSIRMANKSKGAEGKTNSRLDSIKHHYDSIQKSLQASLNANQPDSAKRARLKNETKEEKEARKKSIDSLLAVIRSGVDSLKVAQAEQKAKQAERKAKQKAQQDREKIFERNRNLTRDPKKSITLFKDFKGKVVNVVSGSGGRKDTYCQGEDSLWYPALERQFIDKAGYREKVREKGNNFFGQSNSANELIIAWDFPPIEEIGCFFDEDHRYYNIKRNGYWGVKEVNGNGYEIKHWLNDWTPCKYRGVMIKCDNGVIMNSGDADNIFSLYVNGKQILPPKFRVIYTDKNLGKTGMYTFVSDDETYVANLWGMNQDGSLRVRMSKNLHGYDIKFFADRANIVKLDQIYYIAEKDGKATIYDRNSTEKNTFDCADISKLKFEYRDQAFYDENGVGYDVDPNNSRLKRSAEFVRNEYALNMWSQGQRVVMFDIDVKVTNLRSRKVYVEAVIYNSHNMPFVNSQNRKIRFLRHTYITNDGVEQFWERFLVPNSDLEVKKGQTVTFTMKYRVYYETDSGEEKTLCTASKQFRVSRSN